MYKKGSPETIQKVLDEGGFTDDDLADVATSIVVACSPKNFLDLLGRIKKPELQERAIRKGFQEIFNSHKNCVDPLLTALESSTFDKHLKNVAIQEIFRHGAYYRQREWVEPFLDHPAITPEVFVQRTIYILDHQNPSKTRFFQSY